MLLVLLGIAGLAAALNDQRSLDIVAQGVPTTGTVLTVGVSGTNRAVVTAEFATADGSPVVGDSNRFDVGAVDLRHGDAVEILYNPSEPNVVQGADWEAGNGLLWQGTAWLVVAAATLVPELRARRQGEVEESDDAPTFVESDARPRIVGRPCPAGAVTLAADRGGACRVSRQGRRRG